MENTYLHSRAPVRVARRQDMPHRAPARSDAELLTASIRDPDAFTELFHRHWDDLYRFCLHRAGSAGEDIAAEAFRVAFDRRVRYDARYADARPWLFGIAANVLREHFRSARREEHKRARSAALDGPSARETDLGELERQLLGPDLAAALQDIPAGDRDALLLLAWADLDYEQIGQALDIPLGTVRSRIHRARRRLRAHLDSGDVRHTNTNEA
jgi:RNA polymerase sigma-70 factor (ECF subfamily)